MNDVIVFFFLRSWRDYLATKNLRYEIRPKRPLAAAKAASVN